jgi:serine/threonine protein kinase
MAPELFMNMEADGSDSEEDASPLKVTRYSDVWSFAMLALELLTGKVPFPDKFLDAAVILALIQGERPKHPRSPEVIGRGLNNELWQYLCGCWKSSPEDRLSLRTLHDLLNTLANQWHHMSPGTQDQIESQVTTEMMSVPASAYGSIVGSYGLNIRRYESDFNVKINLTKQGVLVRCEITGLPENVKEARASIESLVEAQVRNYGSFLTIPDCTPAGRQSSEVD